jgi:hypothetical protein
MFLDRYHSLYPKDDVDGITGPEAGREVYTGPGPGTREKLFVEGMTGNVDGRGVLMLFSPRGCRGSNHGRDREATVP